MSNFQYFQGVLGDFLEQLINFGEPRGQEHLAANLEKQMLQGAILTKSSETGYPMFSYQPQDWKDELPLMNASSMVSELDTGCPVSASHRPTRRCV